MYHPLAVQHLRLRIIDITAIMSEVLPEIGEDGVRAYRPTDFVYLKNDRYYVERRELYGGEVAYSFRANDWKVTEVVDQVCIYVGYEDHMLRYAQAADLAKSRAQFTHLLKEKFPCIAR